MPKSTTRRKPEKPYETFPLFAHATGRWAKKIRGKLHYFGPWDNWEGALASYEDQAADLHAGRAPRRIAKPDEVTVAEAVNAFLTAKADAVKTGELTQRSWNEYHAASAQVIEQFGRRRPILDLRAEDFAMLRVTLAEGVSAATLSGRVQRTRTLFKYAYDADIIDRPVKLGPAFKRPTATTLRREKQSRPAKVFSAEEAGRLLASANEPLRTMIFLGLNCAFGNDDVGRLPWSAIDLKTGWVDFPRHKTAVPRRIPLWPETIEGLAAWRETGRSAEDDSLVFITRWGSSYSKTASGSRDNPIAKEFAKLAKAQELTQRGRGFYGLRHTFETVGGETADQVAVNAIMGHVDDSMAANYRAGVSEDRLRKVVDFVHDWVFPPKKRKRRQPR